MPDLKDHPAHVAKQAEEPAFPPMEDTLGPYYPRALLQGFTADLLTPQPGSDSPAGEPIQLSGMILDLNGKPVTGAIVETWQADSHGRYFGDEPDTGSGITFAGFTRQYLFDGRYVVRTIRPGAVPGTGGPARAPHITLTLFCDGVSRLVTQIFFEGDRLNATDPLLTGLPEPFRLPLIARLSSAGGMPSYELDLVLRGANETPFFDDLAG